MLRNGIQDGFGRVSARPIEFCPLSSRMDSIPPRTLLVLPCRPLIVVAKTINDDIPYRTVFRNQQLLGEPDPYRIQDKPPTTKIGKVQVLGAVD